MRWRLRVPVALLLLAVLACSRGEDEEAAAAAARPAGRTPTVFPRQLPVADMEPETAATVFLHWYTGLTTDTIPGPAWREALAGDPPLLASPLQETLEATSALDFDPFLGRGAACERYETAETLGSGMARLVRVHGVCNGERSPAALLVYEMTAREGTWRVFNVHYPTEDTDLLSLLEQRRREE